MTDSLIPSSHFFAGFSAARTSAWRPGLMDDTIPHGEVFASDREATGAALVLALAMDRMRSAMSDPLADSSDERPWLWVQDRAALKCTGRPYQPGLPRHLRHRLIHVVAETAEDTLFALEEGVRCRDLAFVIGEIYGNPKVLGFSVSRRLSLAVERHGVPFWLVRINAARDLGTARMRWQARSASSPRPRRNGQAPGMASWRAELFRARNHPPGEWILCDDGNTLFATQVGAESSAGQIATGTPAPPHPGDMADASGDRSLAAHRRAC